MTSKNRNKADAKARMAKSYASAVGQQPMLIGKPNDMPGWSLYKVGRAMVAMPTLLPTAPNSVKRRYLARITCNATGTCPNCHATAGDPNTSQQITKANVIHETDCSIGDNGPSLDRWIDPAAETLRQAIAYGGAA